MLAIVIPYSTRHRFYLLSHIVDKPQDTCSFPTTSRSCDYCSERMTQRQHTQSIDQRLWFLHFRIPRFMMSYHMTHFISCPRNFLLFRSGSFIRNSTLFEDQQQYVLCNAFAFQHCPKASSQGQRINDHFVKVHKLLFISGKGHLIASAHGRRKH